MIVKFSIFSFFADEKEDPNSEPEIAQDEMTQLLDASNLTLEDVVVARAAVEQ